MIMVNVRTCRKLRCRCIVFPCSSLNSGASKKWEKASIQSFKCLLKCQRLALQVRLPIIALSLDLLLRSFAPGVRSGSSYFPCFSSFHDSFRYGLTNFQSLGINTLAKQLVTGPTAASFSLTSPFRPECLPGFILVTPCTSATECKHSVWIPDSRLQVHVQTALWGQS